MSETLIARNTNPIKRLTIAPLSLQVCKFPAAPASEIRIERFAADADIPRKAPGVANHHRLLRHIAQHDCARPYHCVSSNGNPGNDGCIGPYGRTFLHQRGHQLLASLPYLRTWPSVVGKNGVWTNKYPILDRDQIPESHTIFDRHGIANPHRRLDKRMIADVAVPANDRATHHMGKRPYAGAGTNG